MNHQITIKISAKNAAFENLESYETARILRGIADKLNGPEQCWTVASIDEKPLFDVNGNRVGAIVITHKDGGR